MCLSAEQERKKNLAMREAAKALYNTVDGNRSATNYSSHAAHMPMSYEAEEAMEHGE